MLGLILAAALLVAAQVNPPGTVTVERTCPLAVSEPSLKIVRFPFDQSYLSLHVTNPTDVRYVLRADVQLTDRHGRSETTAALFGDLILPHSAGHYRTDVWTPDYKTTLVQTYVHCDALPNGY